MGETMMRMPALAVVAADHRIVRSTETFRRRCEGAETLCQSSPELQQVLTGFADTATVNAGELSVAIEAVTDAAGRRQAMLTLPPVEPNSEPAPPLTALRDAAEASPAIVWIKDLEGHYLYANPRHGEMLGTTDHRLEGVEEPLYLEYEVPAIDDRPALSVLRFALRDQTGRPIATCGVAAPIAEAHLARAEAVRLMQLERWNRLDPLDVRAELLEQWHLQRAEPVSRPSEVPPTPAPPPTDTAELLQTDLRMARRWADRAEELQSELQQARAAAARANEEAERWRSELEQTRLELNAARAQVAERERDDELERMHARLRSRLGEFETSFDGQTGAPGQRS